VVTSGCGNDTFFLLSFRQGHQSVSRASFFETPGALLPLVLEENSASGDLGHGVRLHASRSDHTCLFRVDENGDHDDNDDDDNVRVSQSVHRR